MPSIRTHATAILIGGLCALTAAWVMASTPFSAPDEPEHYLRAYMLSTGHLLGKRVPYTVPLSPQQTQWVDQSTREVKVPAAMSPPVPCRNGKPDTTGCEEATEVGNYQPLAYLLPAVGLGLSHDATTGLWTARFLSALPCAILLAAAVLLLWDGTLLSILGLALAISPMVFFVSSVINPNGLEIAACAALLAGLLRIARDPPAAGWRVWTATTVAGAVSVLAWQLGPLFVVVDVSVAAMALGPQRLVGWLRRPGRGPWVLAAVFLLSLAAYIVYGQISGSTHLHIGFRPIRASLKAGWQQLPAVLRDSVGNFGALTIHLPPGVYWAYWIVNAALCCAAFVVGELWDRIRLVLIVAGALAFPIVFYAFVYRFSGFGLQGRYLLPVMMIVPIYAGEVLLRARSRRAVINRARTWSSDFAVGVGFGFVGAFQVAAWWIDARAVSGTDSFWPTAGSWAPPLGWWPWLVLAVAGGLCLISLGAGSRSPREQAV